MAAPAGDDPPEPAHHDLRAGGDGRPAATTRVVVGGLEEWNLGPNKRRISEDRLVAKIQELLECPTVQLFAPPAESDDPRAVPHGASRPGSSPSGSSRRREPAALVAGGGRSCTSRALVPYKGGWRYEDPETGRQVPRGPDPLRPGLHQRPPERHRLDQVRPRARARRMRRSALDRGARDERRHPRRLHRVRVRGLAGRWPRPPARGTGRARLLQRARGRGSATTRGRGAAAPRARRSRTGCCCATPPTPTSPQVLRVISIPDADARPAAGGRQGLRRLPVRRLLEVEELRYERKKAKVSAALDGFDEAAILRRDPAAAGQAHPPDARRSSRPSSRP